jgi:uncharacterized protein
MTKMLREFQIFVKPVGAICNLHCSYCYYLEKKELYPSGTRFIMSDKVLEKYIIQHFEASTENTISFSWHGGEPLLAGIDFFRKVIKYQNKHKPAGAAIFNGIQTNGTLITDDWCKFLSDERFIIGLSIDGPADMHNIHRRTVNGSSTHQQVINGFELLKKHGIMPEILCVVNAENVKHPLEVYNYFKRLGASYLTFLPLVERQEGTFSEVTPESVPPVQFGLFLSAIFDEWVEKDIGKIKVQIFEEAARTAFNQDHTLCIFRENCGGVPVVEFSGDFYSCDHYVDSEHKLGNISNNTLAFFLDNKRQKEFGAAKSLTLPRYCLDCEVKAMCNGECPKNRIIETPDGEPGLNYLCSGYRQFFNHCRPFVEAVAEVWKTQKG